MKGVNHDVLHFLVGGTCYRNNAYRPIMIGLYYTRFSKEQIYRGVYPNCLVYFSFAKLKG